VTTPIISVIGPAINTRHWLEFHSSLTTNHATWEIVFVGHVKPEFDLPENFRHIQVGNIKPAQCLEIAAMEARGEYLTVFPDDIFVSKGALDWLHYFKKRLRPFSIVGSRFGKMKHGREKELTEKSILLASESDSPVLPACGMIRKSEWMELGGIDSQFVSTCGDCDLFMRAFVRGGQPFISPYSVVFERDAADDLIVGLNKRFRHDWYFFVHQWFTDIDGKVTYLKQRKEPIIPFDHETIMDHNQGNVKGWII